MFVEELEVSSLELGEFSELNKSSVVDSSPLKLND